MRWHDYLNCCFLFNGCKILSLLLGCTQFVSRATYYRHLTPGVCPGNVNEDPNGVHVISDDVDERDDTYMYTDSDLPTSLKRFLQRIMKANRQFATTMMMMKLNYIIADGFDSE